MNKKTMDTVHEIFSDEVVCELFPSQRTNDFFEALFGDASEGAYDISLVFTGYNEQSHTLRFTLNLHERPGCCLACNLTHGLPEVFSRHPVINIKGLVADIDKKLDGKARCGAWKLGSTVQQDQNLHAIPLVITLK